MELVFLSTASPNILLNNINSSIIVLELKRAINLVEEPSRDLGKAELDQLLELNTQIFPPSSFKLMTDQLVHSA